MRTAPLALDEYGRIGGVRSAAVGMKRGDTTLRSRGNQLANLLLSQLEQAEQVAKPRAERVVAPLLKAPSKTPTRHGLVRGRAQTRMHI
eukprot:1097169-Pleurochrysis_carterae.AAC.1